MIKKIAVLGSTGSIGKQTLEVAKHLKIEVTAISGYSNAELLAKQAREFNIKTVWISEAKYKELKLLLADTSINVITGEEALCELAYNAEADLLLNSLLGISGLKPTLAALDSNRKFALANKETLVAGGEVVMKKAKKNGIEIIPVDSEHSAIFQCLEGKTPKKIILTASGGAFFGKDKEYLKTVTPAIALKHPNWDMGAKITIDSGTLMNKGLELIEAVHIFNIEPQKIDVIVHRESIIHSMVEYNDNAVIGQMGTPDMRLCIQYALTYPNRTKSLAKPLDFSEIKNLSFAKPDEETFKLLPLARNAIIKGGNVPAVMNGANEMAVQLFLESKIGFYDIMDVVEKITNDCEFIADPSVEQIIQSDLWARNKVKSFYR